MHIDVRNLAAAKDQRAAILAVVAPIIEKIDVMRNRVLVATFIEPETTPGGIIKPTRKLDESRFQGKVGLVLKAGPEAFNFDDENKSIVPAVGDWVFYRNADTWECGISGLSCRFIYDDLIVGRVEDPEAIW